MPLTTGADSIVGGAGADTITSLSIKADGTAGENFSGFDAIDGGDGKDTLNIYTTANENEAFPATATVKNVEIVNVYNSAAAAALADASKFVGVTELWQISSAAAVTNLAATTTAGFKTAQAAALSVTGTATAATANVALNGAADADLTDGNAVTLNVAGAAVNAVNVSGTIAAGTNTPATKALTIAVTTGKNEKTITVNTAIDATVTVTENANNTGATVVTAVDFAASTGAVTFVGDADTKTITSGAGKDVITVATTTAKDNVATAADETITANVTTGAGNDSVTVNVTGDGKTNVTTGAGDDTVAITGRGTSVLNVDLGEGADTFTSGVAIAATDTIDAGAGSDTLLLSLVGSANVAAFKNFDVYDVKAMAANLDLDILNAGNTVTEIIGSAALGGAVTLQNVTTNFRATGHMGTTNALTLTQKTAGALTVTLDADETGTADAGDDVASVSVAAAAATSVSAVFDAAYLAKAGDVSGETAATDNVSTIALATQAAASLSVVSGGAFSKNVLNVTEGGGTDALTSVSVTGAQALTLAVTGASKLASVDASAATGGLTASLADLKDGGNITLGAGTDKITATNTSTTDAAESITGFAKTAAVAVSAVAGDAVAKAAAIAAADVLVLATAAVLDADYNGVGAGNGTLSGGAVDKGVLTFTGSGPSTLTAAITIAGLAAETDGEAVAFEYLGNTYVFVQGTTDTVVKLAGITGVTNFVESTTADNFFIV
jgi:trimeric autotransporter adhesin